MRESPTDGTPETRILGIEGGGTKTEWVLLDAASDCSWSRVDGGFLPASNLRHISDAQLLALFSVLPREVDRVGAFLAGCATTADRARLQQAAESTWPQAQHALGSDRDSAMAAAFGERDGIVIIAGTGAVVHGRRGDHIEKAGGWGQILGDRGSGFHLAMRGLRCVLSTYDLDGKAPPLARTILRMLGLNRLQDLVAWVSSAEKMDVARLAPAVFEAVAEGDDAMREIIEDGALILAEYTEAVSRRLGDPRLPVRFFGGIFEHHPEYVALTRAKLEWLLPEAELALCTKSGALGAAWLARMDDKAPIPRETPPEHSAHAAELASAATEQRNPRSKQMDKLPTPELVQLFIDEEQFVAAALADARGAISRAVDQIAVALAKGGRLFYVGAGTSGRLGVLDASEIPPTFGASPDLVQGIIAGGASALHRSVEGAEDQPAEGALALLDRGVHDGDVVCGVAASGRTPFVLGALARARELGAGTILLTCNPARRPSPQPWDVEIDLPTGPELVTGSTRLKAGTATKLVLNILTTCAMVRLGRVRGHLMVNVQVTNEKLRLRALRLVAEVLQVPEDEARARLRAHQWNVLECLSAHGAA